MPKYTFVVHYLHAYAHKVTVDAPHELAARSRIFFRDEGEVVEDFVRDDEPSISRMELLKEETCTDNP